MNIEKVVVGPLETNCYIVSKNSHAFIVDPGADHDLLKNRLLKLGLELDFIIYTHGHADHIKGGDGFDVPMYIHHSDAPCLSDSSLNLSSFVGAPFVLDSISELRILHDGDTIEFQNETMHILHTPGHTLGGICLLLGDKLFSGDTLFCRSIGRSDFHGGNHETLVSSIANKIFMLPDETDVYPGHGNQTVVGEEKKLNPFFSL